MDNSTCIEKVLKDLNIIYKKENMEWDDYNIGTYIIHFLVDNKIIYGGLLDGGANDDKHITIMFFIDVPYDKTPLNKYQILIKVNNLNKYCKYGSFSFDGEDINYNLSIPAIDGDLISEKVFRFYFENVISVLKGAISEVIDE